MTDVVVALDAGGTKLLGGLVTRDGEVLAREERPTPRTPAGCDPGLAELATLALSLADIAARAGHRVRGSGLGMAEYVLDNRLTSAEVFAWDRQPVDLLVDVLSNRSEGPVSVDADVRCAALAEVAARPERRAGCLVYISWGTGLSSCVVLDGRALAGRRGEALALGEWGVDARVDGSWAGNLEQYASGHGVGTRYGEIDGRPATGADVAALATRGDPKAADIQRTAARALAAAIAALTQVLDPDVVVLGGGIGARSVDLAAAVAAGIPDLSHRPGPPTVVTSAAGADVGLLGAAIVGWQGVDRIQSG